MKAIKIIVALGVASGLANAATITVSAGLTAQGVTPLVDGVALPNFFVSVGNWDAGTSTFTSFASVLGDTGEVSGAFTATSPASFNGSLISVFVGKANSIAGSNGAWAVFTSVAGTKFPADVAAATGVSFSMTTPAALTLQATGGLNQALGTGNTLEKTGWVTGGTNTNQFNIVTVPETSTALLGALGALGLLRRRR